MQSFVDVVPERPRAIPVAPGEQVGASQYPFERALGHFQETAERVFGSEFSPSGIDGRMPAHLPLSIRERRVGSSWSLMLTASTEIAELLLGGSTYGPLSTTHVEDANI